MLGPHTQALRGQGLSSSELARRLSRLPEVEWAVVDERRRIHNWWLFALRVAAMATGFTLPRGGGKDST